MAKNKGKRSSKKSRNEKNKLDNSEADKLKRFDVDKDIKNWSPADKMCYFMATRFAKDKGRWFEETIIQYMRNAYNKGPYRILTTQLPLENSTKYLMGKGITIELPEYVYILLDDTGTLHLNFGGDEIPFETTSLGGAEGSLSFDDLAVSHEDERLDRVRLSGMNVYATLDDGTEVHATVQSISLIFRSMNIVEAGYLKGLQIHTVETPARVEVDNATVWYGKGKTRFKGTFDKINAKNVLGSWEIIDFAGKVNMRRETALGNPSFSIPIRSAVEEMILEYFNTEVIPKDIISEDERFMEDSRSLEIFIRKWKF